MFLLIIFPVLMIGTIVAVALTSDSFHAEQDSDYFACCGAQKYEKTQAAPISVATNREAIAA